MLAPMLIAAASLILIGVFNRVITEWIGTALATFNLVQGG